MAITIMLTVMMISSILSRRRVPIQRPCHWPTASRYIRRLHYNAMRYLPIHFYTSTIQFNTSAVRCGADPELVTVSRMSNSHCWVIISLWRWGWWEWGWLWWWWWWEWWWLWFIYNRSCVCVCQQKSLFVYSKNLF